MHVQYMHAHAYISPCLRMLIHMHDHKYTYSYTCPFICSPYMFIHVKHTQTCISIHIHTLTHTYPPHVCTCMPTYVNHMHIYACKTHLIVVLVPRGYGPFLISRSSLMGFFQGERQAVLTHFFPVFPHVCVALWSLSKPWHELIVPTTLCFSGSLKFPP